MFRFHQLSRRLGAAAIALIALAAPLAARAQDIPSYAQPAYVSTDETIHGRIRSVDGAFNITVDDDRGFVDNVQLHQGTIINPTGLTLSPGMSVTILGTNAGSTFGANEIDTPYTYAGPLPTPVFLGPGYWYPGFAYGYGPSFSLAIVIGGGYGPWSYVHHPFYGRPWNGHAYFGGYVGRNVPVSGARVAVTRAASDPASHAPAAFAGRTFAGASHAVTDSRSAGYGSTAYRTPASPAGYAHGSAPAAGYARGTAMGAEHGGYSHGGGGHGGGAAAHGGGGHTR